MSTTKTWAESLGIATAVDLAAIADYSRRYACTAQQIATRAVILQGVVAIAYKVDAQPVVEWFQAQGIWDAVTPQERAFLGSSQRKESERVQFQWKQEAEWTLLWIIGRVESLGLPIHCCDTRRLVNEIVPTLGDDLQDFIAQSELRSPGALLAEDDRTYDLWCNAIAARRRGESLPTDLNLAVLRERRYAFEWMGGNDEWDEVTCDS